MTVTDIRDRMSQVRRLSAPDLWPEIIARSQIAPARSPLEHRLVVFVVAFSVAIAGVAIGVYAFRSASTPGGRGLPSGATSSGATGTASPSSAACVFPGLRPDSLPWLAAGEPVPTPEAVAGYNRINWFGPQGTPWADSYVSLRLLKEAPDLEGSVAPRLPDGTAGVVVNNQGEWDIFWQNSTFYCGAVAMYVYLRPFTSDEVRSTALDLAASLRAGAPMEPTAAQPSD